MIRHTIAAAALMLMACTTTHAPSPATPEFAITFDDAGARTLAQALAGPPLDQMSAAKLLEVHGVAAMVDNATRFVPAATRDQFVTDIVAFTGGKTDLRSYFALPHVAPKREQMLALLDQVAGERSAIAGRMVQKLSPLAPPGRPVTLPVYLVAGGVSDGFVFEGRSELALYLAADRANGDLVGLEQNATHELAHVLQKIAASSSPGGAAFVARFAEQPAVDRFAATTLWEGGADLAADPRTMPAGGDYMAMWRRRYDTQLEPQTLAASFAAWSSDLGALQTGTKTFDVVYAGGFDGSVGSPYYFVGMEMLRALIERRARRT